MKTRLLALLATFFGTVKCPGTDLPLAKDVVLQFASVDEGRHILGQRDEFVRRMSEFDRAVRLKQNGEVSETRYLEFVRASVLPWDDADQPAVAEAVEGLRANLAAWDLPFPEKIHLIKTTGEEEGGAAYTRAQAIVLPARQLALPLDQLRRLIAHELFHILSRANPGLREELYRAIGFRACAELEFPPTLRDRKITNPDAPRHDHAIRISAHGREHWAIPILFARVAPYDPATATGLFEYLRFRLLVVELDDVSTPVPRYDAQAPQLLDVAEVSGFFEQVGRNTTYIIHPEEILADNLALLVTGTRDVASIEVLESVERILARAGSAKAESARDASSRADPPDR